MIGHITSFDTEFAALRALSARVGANPLQVQGAGGNTSIKHDGRLWIKASGKWLAHAEAEDMFVPVRLRPVLDAVEAGLADAEKAELFVDQWLNPASLRPSIETTVHALMPQNIVVHIHCVNTIALAVQENAKTEAARRLAGFNYKFIPYARPGLPLARAIAEQLTEDTNVLILGNHGLVVAADTVAGADALLREVCQRLASPARVPPQFLPLDLERLALQSDYRLPLDPRAHGAATDPVSCEIAAGGSLYPDHVVFLGQGSHIAMPRETAVFVKAEALDAGHPPPPSILFQGFGVLMRRDASPGADAMAGCLADVTARIGPGAKLRYLSKAEQGELLNWDAEKYRQDMNKSRGDAK
jgi:rhamnose utilization protein RhaD (predicted bifunctional aldolase and dehydrogenase)